LKKFKKQKQAERSHKEKRAIVVYSLSTSLENLMTKEEGSWSDNWD
jgi:hypothetical protein